MISMSLVAGRKRFSALGAISAMLVVAALFGPSSAGAMGAESPASALFVFDSGVDPEVRALVEHDLAVSEATIRAFFGTALRGPIKVVVADSRSAFNAAFPPEWGMSQTECWMVASGVADGIILLSPRRWSEEACEHDSSDQQHVQDILVHELVHVFHGQKNPTRDFTGADDIGWFIEGLAVHVSGQLHHGHLAEAREAIAKNQAPASLDRAWSGKYRYGVCGSLVEYIDRTQGREKLRALLSAATEADILGKGLGITEESLLSAWRADVGAMSDPDAVVKSNP